MYILIFEDGTMFKAADISEQELEYCDEGLLTVLSVEDPENPLAYAEGEWLPLDFV